MGSGSNVKGFWDYLYFSGSNFFTLGLGDVTPHSIPGKILTVVEAGLGLGFLALIIGYLPALNQSFASREQAHLQQLLKCCDGMAMKMGSRTLDNS